MKRLIGVILICTIFASCVQSTSSATSSLPQALPHSQSAVPQPQDYYTEGSKTIYPDGYVPCNSVSNIWLDKENILICKSAQSEGAHSTKFYKLNINIKKCIPYDNEYTDFFNPHSVLKQDNKYLVSDISRNIIAFDETSWQPTGKYFEVQSYAAMYDMETETTYEYDYYKREIVSKKNGVVKTLMPLKINEDGHSYIASLILSPDKSKLAFVVMREAMSTQVITIDLATNEPTVYELSLPVPGILWMDNKLFLLDYNNLEVYARLFDNGEQIGEMKVGLADGVTTTTYNTQLDNLGSYENIFPYIVDDGKTSAIYLLSVKSGKLETRLIEELAGYVHTPQISEDGKHITYYFTQDWMSSNEKRYFVVQKLD